MPDFDEMYNIRPYLQMQEASKQRVVGKKKGREEVCG
jgi:hypothetical protein